MISRKKGARPGRPERADTHTHRRKPGEETQFSGWLLDSGYLLEYYQISPK